MLVFREGHGRAQGEEGAVFDTLDRAVDRWMEVFMVGWHGGLGMQCHHVQGERGRGQMGVMGSGEGARV